MSGLTVTDLSLHYGPTVALDHLDLMVAPGEIVAIVGPSGCGKSSLLRSIAGLEAAAEGTIEWDGRPVEAKPTHQRGFGLMFQHHALFPHRSVADNVAFGLRMQGATTAQQRARTGELLELVDLADYGDRMPDTLSGGEAQRVALARSLAPKPGLLLLDEPLGSLDRHLREQLVTQLRSVLTALDQTAIHVTHDLEEAYTVADRAAVMRNGIIEQIAPPDVLWREPRNEFVARFVGHTAITERDGRRVVIRSDACSIAAGGEPATVLSTSFRGDRTAVVAALSDGTPVSVYCDEPPEVGETVAIAIDSTRISDLGPSEFHHDR